LKNILKLKNIREEFEFLRGSSYKKLVDGTEGFRLKTIRLRKQISQGLVLPLSILEDHDPKWEGWTWIFLCVGLR